MANYECATRTNYFHVKDEDAFRKFAEKICCSEDAIDVWEKDDNGKKVFAFGGFGEIMGLNNAEDDCSYDEFLKELQEHIAEDDAVIILESGKEKLRYITGYATVVTSSESKFANIADIAIDIAKKALNNQNWSTDISY